MKILLVHNAYGKTGGEEVVIDGLAALLEARGVVVRRFSRSSAEIEATSLGEIQAFFSGIHNPFSRKAFGQFLRQERPDIVHIHNLYPLISPSILPECTAQGIPVGYGGRSSKYKLFTDFRAVWGTLSSKYKLFTNFRLSLKVRRFVWWIFGS